MDDLKDFLQGAAKFNDTESLPIKPLLERLAREGQTPDALFMTCADSRVDPLLIMQAKPGDLFILRNIGNLVPKVNGKDTSVMATVEYSVGALGVKTIAICGHSDCGAMKAVLSHKDLSSMPHAQEWLSAASRSVENYENGGYDQVVFEEELPEHDKLSKINVVTQFENLLTYPIVREGIEQDTLRLVGMWFDIGNATVEVYDPASKTFCPVDQDEVSEHLKHPRTAAASVLGSAVACAVWDGHFDMAITATTAMGL